MLINISKPGHKGFTLIELLITMAIIGILSSVVLASVNTARGKSKDSKIKTQLSSLRNAAEIYYDAHGYYGSEVSDSCTTSDFFTDPDGMSQITDVAAYPSDTTLSCHTDTSSYAVSALLPGAGGGVAWCVDSSGASRQIAANLADGEVACP